MRVPSRLACGRLTTMVRFEAAIETPLAFRQGGLLSGRVSDAISLEFDGSDYVWHAGGRDGGRPCWPVVTVMLFGAVDTTVVETRISRLLSALSFHYDVPMSIAVTMGSGWKHKFDRPLIGQPGFGARQLAPPPRRVDVAADDRLRLTLALWREARSARSPAYRYLAFYNALDAAFDDDQDARSKFVADQMRDADLPEGASSANLDWVRYLREVLRNAVAHAVRPAGRPVLDPDDASDRHALTSGAAHLALLVRRRMEQRWECPVRVLQAS